MQGLYLPSSRAHKFACAALAFLLVCSLHATMSNVPPASGQEVVSDAARASLTPAPQDSQYRLKGIDIYVDREGWQSGIGLRAMEHYVQRLANHVQKNIPGLIAGIAGGKRGILLVVTYRGRRNFFRARENTEIFLKAIVEDLATRLPEPVAPYVVVRYEGEDIIVAERIRGRTRVKFIE